MNTRKHISEPQNWTKTHPKSMFPMVEFGCIWNSIHPSDHLETEMGIFNLNLKAQVIVNFYWMVTSIANVSLLYIAVDGLCITVLLRAFGIIYGDNKWQFVRKQYVDAH